MNVKSFNELEKIEGIEIIYSVSTGQFYTTFEEAEKEALNQIERKEHERKHPYAGVKDNREFEVYIDRYTWNEEEEMYISHCNTKSEYIWSKSI